MTLVTTNIKDTFGTDAEFRTQCSAIHAFLAATCTQTADTGQINLATVLKPTGTLENKGYEIWRFNDSLQATAPIYFKIEYGSNNAASTNPLIFLTVGSGSDGAGTITATGFPSGTITTRRFLTNVNTGSGGSTSPASYFDYMSDGTGFVMCLWPGVTTSLGSFGFAIERFRDSDGSASGDGVSVFHFAATNSTGGSAQNARFFIAGATSQPTSEVTNWISPYSLLGVANASALMGTVMRPWPVFTGALPRLGGPSQLLFLAGRGDLALSTTFSMSHYGTSRTWLSLGGGPTATGWGSINAGGGLVAIIMRGD